MTDFSCPQCGAAMALAETHCASCGAQAPQGRAALFFLKKAEQAAQAGNLDQSVRNLQKALQAGLPEAESALAWRKLGIRQQRLGQWEPAADSFHQAMQLSASDETAHQLWIDSLSQLGRLSQAKEYYQQRLIADPGDAMAERQLKVLELRARFQSRPPATPNPGAPVSSPSWKLALSGSLPILCLSLAAVAWLHRRHAGGKDALALDETAVPMMNPLSLFLGDPWIWLLLALCSGVFLFLTPRRRG